MYRDAPLSVLHHSDFCSEAWFIIMTRVRNDSSVNYEGIQSILTAVCRGYSQPF